MTSHVVKYCSIVSNAIKCCSIESYVIGQKNSVGQHVVPWKTGFFKTSCIKMYRINNLYALPMIFWYQQKSIWPKHFLSIWSLWASWLSTCISTVHDFVNNMSYLIICIPKSFFFCRELNGYKMKRNKNLAWTACVQVNLSNLWRSYKTQGPNAYF